MKEKKLNLMLYTFVSIVFMELIFRIITIESFFSRSLIYILLSSFLVTSFVTFICSLFRDEKLKKTVYFILLFFISFWMIAELVYKNTLNVFFSISMLKLADQVMTFWQDTLLMVIKNLPYIIVIFIPFITGLLIKKKLDFESKNKDIIMSLSIFIVSLLIFKCSLLINKKESYSAYELYYKVNETSLNIEKFGVYVSTYLDIHKTITGISEEVVLINNKNNRDKEETEVKYDYNINNNIDFNKLISNESNNTLKSMHEYFNSDSGTQKNKYTGYFKNKNLILFMAESFNSIAVKEDFTSTLYELTSNGFVFNNFYTPVNNSTIGGEFQELTGLFANNAILKTWRNGGNYFPYGLANSFKSGGYKTFAYHDHYYTFQDRNKYLKAIGFDNFTGCYNGLEKKINCKSWPESDVEMINATFDDYINEDKFMVFYASVSGHGDYSWSGNNMSKKHQKETASFPYSERAKAYLAAQKEFNDALELLLKKLKDANKLDDTVIAFVGDHYPYMLSLNEINELSTYKRDGVVEINRSNFALYNSKMKKIEIDKVGSEIDVIPTIYNLFGLDYDSRLFIGKDILSTEPGLAIMNNRSWVSDKGTYFAAEKKFVLKDGATVDEQYVNNMNKIVSSKITMSKNIIEQNYYKKVLGD